MSGLIFAVFAVIAAFPDRVPGIARLNASHRWITSSFVYLMSLLSMGAALFGVAYATSDLEAYAFFLVAGVTVLIVPFLLKLPGRLPTRLFGVWHGLVHLGMIAIIAAGFIIAGDGPARDTSVVIANLIWLFCAICALIGIYRVLWRGR